MAKDGEQEFDLDDEDRLPWLEAADDYDDDAASPGKLLLLVLAGLLLIGAVLGGLWWMQNGGSRGTGELIAAQDGSYKVAPKDDAAKDFEGEGDASFAASEGVEPSGTVDPSRLPEEPAVADGTKAGAAKAAVDKQAGAKPAAGHAVAAPAKPAPAKPAIKPAATPVKPAAPAAHASTPASGGSALIQLGAFSSEAAAAKAWISLSRRFAYLSGLAKTVAPATLDGGTVYRLRANAGSAASANSICGKLRIAGESCVVVR